MPQLQVLSSAGEIFQLVISCPPRCLGFVQPEPLVGPLLSHFFFDSLSGGDSWSLDGEVRQHPPPPACQVAEQIEVSPLS